MITINYQMYGKGKLQLRLRLYQDGETKFISVTRFLKGDLKRTHWNARKQHITPGAPFSKENNEILAAFKHKYEEKSIGWTGSAFGLIAAAEDKPVTNTEPTISEFIQVIVGELNKHKHPDGTSKGSFENYLKCERRLQEFCKLKKTRYEKILITELGPTIIDKVFEWIDVQKGGKGKGYMSATLHSIVMKADKAGYLKAEDFNNCNWWKKPKGSVHKYYTLTEAQCKKFKKVKLTGKYASPLEQLYRDFCLFILYTGQSVCDAVALRYSDIVDIGGTPHFVFKRRKIAEKQAVPCSVPINDELQSIMDKWKHKSQDGYIFPIRSKKKLKEQTTNNGDIKHFIGKLNHWLKHVGVALGCSFPLHTYVFRHTAITRYISKGVPVIYVANMMGTSVENCQNIYYNNQGDVASRNKVMAAMAF